jgi:hypothetical protein
MARNASTEFLGDVYITAPLGYFELLGSNGVFYMKGKAARVSIPSAGINVD